MWKVEKSEKFGSLKKFRGGKFVSLKKFRSGKFQKVVSEKFLPQSTNKVCVWKVYKLEKFVSESSESF